MLGCLVELLRPVTEVRVFVAAELAEEFAGNFELKSNEVREYSGAGQPDQVLSAWQELSQTVDFGWVVAPEMDGLLHRASAALHGQTTLINCSQNFLALASDKWQTATKLKAAEVPHPNTYLASDSKSALAHVHSAQTWVYKRADGAGCDGVRLFDRAGLAALEPSGAHVHAILQPWLQGEHFSASFYAGPNSLTRIGVATQKICTKFQRVTLDGLKPADFVPDRDAMWSVAEAAVGALGPHGLGWIGVDMVYETETRTWLVIEINPRCTSSIELFAHEDRLARSIAEVLEVLG